MIAILFIFYGLSCNAPLLAISSMPATSAANKKIAFLILYSFLFKFIKVRLKSEK